jgi:hypothetical protein
MGIESRKEAACTSRIRKSTEKGRIMRRIIGKGLQLLTEGGRWLILVGRGFPRCSKWVKMADGNL